ncbi:TRM82 [Candida jiufengensis]|uniref:TRM82 n=1 Tax=Candida jiufengensis TaxID=497108 RepID=UPI00222473B2|nr:TRM82 [Candida jiufengensis]KAI5950318.1 TRM82 [Candida jiufengensis]
MKHPFQILLANELGTHLYAAVKNHIIVYNLSTGSQLGHWFDEQQSQHINDQQIRKTGKTLTAKSKILNHIKCLSITKDEKYLIASTDSDKSILIFELNFINQKNCLKLSKRQPMPKRPSSITTTTNEVIVADKFGDVYSIPIDSNEPKLEKNLQPLLGHVSMLTDVLVTSHNNKQFLITSDRDEHIRISNYPKSYVIRNFLLSHENYISSLSLIKGTDYLISGGGDDYILVWNWVTGELITKFDIKSEVASYLTDDHFVPEKFRIDERTTEINISKISNMKKGNKTLVLVLVEKLSVLVILEFDGKELKSSQTIHAYSPLITFTNSKDKVIVSIDPKDSEESEDLNYIYFEIYKFNKENELLPDNDSSHVVRKIESHFPVEVKNREEFAELYPVSALRKRSEH